MTSYLALATKYLSVHKSKSRLVIISVAIAVALVTGIFSMLDAFLQFERIQVIHDTGNYHLMLKDPTDAERATIASRLDVQNAGTWIGFHSGTVDGKDCALAATDAHFAPNMNIAITQGHFPAAVNEIALERWAAASFLPPLSLGDSVTVSFADHSTKQFVLSGLFDDFGTTKAADTPGVMLSMAAAQEATAEKGSLYLIEFKSGVDIAPAEQSLVEALNLDATRLAHNERLIAITGQSTNESVIAIYGTGAVLFFFVLVAGVLMIFNTFNISIMERVRQFGLLRCLGASQSQIKSLVRREALYIVIRAIPLGVIAGVLITLLCTTLLKFYNSSLFADIPLLQLSLPGIAAGIVIGFLTVFIASWLPARKAAGVPPILAMTSGGNTHSPRRKRGLLTRVCRIEIALGLNNATSNKRTLLLMSSSIAISIVLFLGFQVFIDFMNSSMKTTKPYSPDISLMADQGKIDHALAQELTCLEGIDKVYGRMFGHVEATFDAARLTSSYRQAMGDIVTNDDGTFVPPEKSWLISYDQNQLAWSQPDLIEGELSEEKLNQGHGLVAVVMHLRNNITAETTTLHLGDKVRVNTPQGPKEMTVMAILRTVPFSDSELTLTTFLTTEKLFAELTGESAYDIIDLQLAGAHQEQTAAGIKNLIPSGVSFHDVRQKNAEVDQAFFTMAIFVYGFIGLIALISALNIVNTMNTSVAAKTRYLGVLRAIGMSDAQVNTLVFCEAITYSLIGGIVGCLLGTALQKWLIDNQFSQFHMVWKLPTAQLGLIIILILLLTVISIVGPLRRIKAQRPPDAIGSLQ